MVAKIYVTPEVLERVRELASRAKRIEPKPKPKKKPKAKK